MKPEVLIGSPERLAIAAARRLELSAMAGLAGSGKFSLALPGGSVAEIFFPRLAQAQVDWSRIDFFWGDERAVPVSDPDSNFGLARKLWLDPAAVPAERRHRLHADFTDPAELAAAANSDEEILLRTAGRPPRIDMFWLGVGPDGHVASLFPDHPLLAETKRYVAAVVDSPKPPRARLTMTLPAILGAKEVVVAAFGTGKAQAIAQALDPQGPDSPLGRVIRGANRVWLLIDAAAAAQWTENSSPEARA
ncbi:MAG: 6-phosphogluconolactonase [Thermoanaerobaculia bacterium]